MDEQTQTPNQQVETKTEPSILEKADSIASRLEAANVRAEALVKRQEEALSKIMLSGRAEAGIVKKTAEQIQQEEIDARVKSGLSRFR